MDKTRALNEAVEQDRCRTVNALVLSIIHHARLMGLEVGPEPGVSDA